MDRNKRELYVYLILSKMCNLRHTFCFQNDFSTTKLSDDILYKKLLPLYERIKVLRLHGGEITIIPGALELVKFLGKNFPQMLVNIVTNGVELDDDWMDVIEKNNITLNISVNATTAETTASMLKNKNGEAIHQKIYTNLYRILDIHKRSNKNIINAITMAVCNNNVHEIEPFAKLAASLGVNIMFQFPCEMNAKISQEILSGVYNALKMKYYFEDYITINLIHSPLKNKHLEIYEAIKNKLDKEKDKYIRELNFQPKASFNRTVLCYDDIEAEIDNGFKCIMPWKGLFIDSDGFVFPCSNMSGFVLGNIYCEQIEDILSSRQRYNLQEQICDNNYLYCWKNCNSNYYPSEAQMVSKPYVPKYRELFNTGQYDVAIESYNKIINTSLFKVNEMYEYAYCLHVTNHDLNKAVEMYNLALKNGFDEFWVTYNRADAYLRLGEEEKAKEDIMAAYSLNSEHEGIKQLYKRYILKEGINE